MIFWYISIFLITLRHELSYYFLMSLFLKPLHLQVQFDLVWIHRQRFFYRSIFFKFISFQWGVIHHFLMIAFAIWSGCKNHLLKILIESNGTWRCSNIGRCCFGLVRFDLWIVWQFPTGSIGNCFWCIRRICTFVFYEIWARRTTFLRL